MEGSCCHKLQAGSKTLQSSQSDLHLHSNFDTRRHHAGLGNGPCQAAGSTYGSLLRELVWLPGRRIRNVQRRAASDTAWGGRARASPVHGQCPAAGRHGAQGRGLHQCTCHLHPSWRCRRATRHPCYFWTSCLRYHAPLLGGLGLKEQPPSKSAAKKIPVFKPSGCNRGPVDLSEKCPDLDNIFAQPCCFRQFQQAKRYPGMSKSYQGMLCPSTLPLLELMNVYSKASLHDAAASKAL